MPPSGQQQSLGPEVYGISVINVISGSDSVWMALATRYRCVRKKGYKSITTERLGVSFPRLNEIIRGKRSVTPDTALRLARVLGMSADFWLGLQQDWDLWHAMRTAGAKDIARLKPLARGA